MNWSTLHRWTGWGLMAVGFLVLYAGSVAMVWSSAPKRATPETKMIEYEFTTNSVQAKEYVRSRASAFGYTSQVLDRLKEQLAMDDGAFIPFYACAYGAFCFWLWTLDALRLRWLAAAMALALGVLILLDFAENRAIATTLDLLSQNEVAGNLGRKFQLPELPFEKVSHAGARKWIAYGVLGIATGLACMRGRQLRRFLGTPAITSLVAGATTLLAFVPALSPYRTKLIEGGFLGGFLVLATFALGFAWQYRMDTLTRAQTRQS